MDFRKILEECKADSLVFFTDGSHVDENFYYFTGLSKSIQVTSTVIVTRNGPVIVTNRLEAGIFRGKKEIIENREDAEKAMRKHAGKKVGIDYSSITARRFMHFRRVLKGRKITDISKNMEAIRSVKDRHEIIKIREACRIAEEILDDMGALVRKSRTEKDLAAELDYAARRNDAEALSFPPIVASGKNSAIPHHVPGKSKLGKGILLADFGVVHEGYCSDLTRVFCIGKSDEETRNVYDVVYSAQQAAISAIKDGANSRDIHAAADKILESRLGKKMIHSVGHGIGIAIHEQPGISEKSKNFLKNNMVITAEPGYYKRGWGGIRIEDDVLVGKKAILLSRAPSFLTEI